MSTMTIETKVTYKYLMNQTKDRLATWILSNLDFIDDLENFHFRAMKLMKKHKNFLVVAEDEPYFIEVYELIKKNEMEKGRWTVGDDKLFWDAYTKKNRPNYP